MYLYPEMVAPDHPAIDQRRKVEAGAIDDEEEGTRAQERCAPVYLGVVDVYRAASDVNGRLTCMQLARMMAAVMDV
jgi:hypothetical protein